MTDSVPDMAFQNLPANLPYFSPLVCQLNMDGQGHPDSPAEEERASIS